MRAPARLILAAILVVVVPARARADLLCDPSFQDCRETLLNLIRAETTGIDVAFWFMEDARYSAELIRKAQQGVAIRVLVDTRANAGHPINGDIIAQLAAAGIPIRNKTGGPILHWKMMLFAGLGQVEFSGANYSPGALTPITPYVNYTDEGIYFSNDPAIVRSFMRKFDDSWIDPSLFTDYANVKTRTRKYSLFAIAPELNFPPGENYRTRALAAYAAEPSAIDVIMFRITDRAHTDAMIAAAQRGVRVRLITEMDEYRNASRMWHSWNVDRLYAAGIPVRVRAHAGLNHEKAVILRGQGMTIFGSSNWTSPSADGQQEHNLFTTRPFALQFFTSQFDRKWTNATGNLETEPFVPLPPDAPSYTFPADGAVGVGRDTVLQFSAGPFAHLYDIYLGVTPDPPLIASNVELGPSTGAALSYRPPTTLRSGTTYYWRVVAKTMALQATAGPIARFTTAGAPSALAPGFDGDLRADLTVWRPGTGMWYSLISSTGYTTQTARNWGTGSLGDVPLLGDVDGDGIADLIVWRPGSGTWFWLTSSSGYTSQGTKTWGGAGDIPLLADIDGDRQSDLIVWRPSTGTWFWLTSSSGYVNQGSRSWGGAGDKPLLADFDGDGKADLTVWRPSTGWWYWLKSSSNYTTAGQIQWGSGSVGDVPLVGDLDGDGRSEVIVWRGRTGDWFWVTSSSGYTRQGTVRWGSQSGGDIPLIGDFDGDGVDDIGVWRASNGTWYWLLSSTAWTAGVAKTWGGLGDIPLVR
jgi:phosphatidylserine/phosphatidylglycerophosphate/cardiolipin synthase-like enzyme